MWSIDFCVSTDAQSKERRNEEKPLDESINNGVVKRMDWKITHNIIIGKGALCAIPFDVYLSQFYGNEHLN